MWYNFLPSKSINMWEALEDIFLIKWGVEKDEALLLSRFDKITKHEQNPVR